MLSGAKNYIRDYPHMLLFPGLFIAITVLGLNMFGDGLRDALDPKLKD
jgi:peptide/nickel transport system permease protein